MHNRATRTGNNLQLPMILLLAAYIVLSVIYAWATPVLEASDELWHFGMINTIANTGQLPVQVPKLKTAYEQEGSQPPLYYLIGAWLIEGIDRSDFDILRQPNPHVVAGVPGNFGNKNLVLHDSPHLALRGTVLAVYVMRVFSILLGCTTLSAIYVTARRITPNDQLLPILAVSLVAFNPMFLFISASVNNDNLVTAINSLVIWQLVGMIRSAHFSWRRSLGIAVLLALASLSKLSGLVLLPFAALVGMWVSTRGTITKGKGLVDWHSLLQYGAIIGAVWVVVAGWWYMRNVTLYGELFGTRMMVAVAGARTGGFGLRTLVDEFQGFRFAYWALFGAVNIMTFRWFYDVMDLLSVVMLAGLVSGVFVAVRKRLWSSEDAWLDDWAIYGLLTLVIVAGTVSVVAWTAQTYASQGRLLFPFNAAISILGARGVICIYRYGISQFLPAIVKDRLYKVGYVVPCVFAVFALIVPFASIIPEYAEPTVAERLPPDARAVYANFGDFTLVGYAVDDRRYVPDDVIPLTIYWQVKEPSNFDYSLYLHAILNDGTEIGKIDSYPGAGRLRTSTWQAGAIYADRYGIRLTSSNFMPSRLRVQVGWWNYATGEGLRAFDQDQHPIETVMLDVGGAAPLDVRSTLVDKAILEPIDFGGRIALIGYQLVDDHLTLVWRATAFSRIDYTVFVQALDVNNQVVGQGDAPPQLPTHYWRNGEEFITEHTITSATPIPSGKYRIVVGWYDPVDGTRLGTQRTDNTYLMPVTLDR